MSKEDIRNYIENCFNSDFLPSLMNYIRIPCISKLQDPDWEKNKYLQSAAELICNYAKNLGLKNATIEIIKDNSFTPLVFMDIKASRPNDNRSIVLYCHYDKQLPAEGWDPGKGPFTPVIENGRLYGRGAVDDGYASFSIITAIKCCQDLNLPLPRIFLIVEGAEETDATDLEYYFKKLSPLFENLSLFISLDSSTEDYDHIWATACLRGSARLKFTIKTLSRKIQSDFYGGTVPDNYMILRTLMSKIQNEKGEILIEEFKYPEEKIPERRKNEIKTLVEELGEEYKKSIPLYENTQPLKDDVYELIMNNLWRPSCTIVGCDGISKENDNDQLVDSLSVILSIRYPPYVDGKIGSEKVKKMVEELKPFGSQLSCEIIETNFGFDLADEKFSVKLQNALDIASRTYFGKKLCFTGAGVTIPFLNFFQNIFPKAEIANLGISGRECFEHGANENLNLDACKKIIMSLAYTLSRY